MAFAVWLLLVLALAVAPGGGPLVSTQTVVDVLVIVLGTALVGLLAARD